MLQALSKKNYKPQRKHTFVKLFFPTPEDLHSLVV